MTKRVLTVTALTISSTILAMGAASAAPAPLSSAPAAAAAPAFARASSTAKPLDLGTKIVQVAGMLLSTVVGETVSETRL